MQSTSTPCYPNPNGLKNDVSIDSLAQGIGFFFFWLVEIYSELQRHSLYGGKILDKN